MGETSHNLNRAGVGRFGVGIALVLGGWATPVRAGSLWDLYESTMITEESQAAAVYHLKAAEQHIETRRRLYWPRLALVGRELFVSQEIRATDTTVYREGTTDYSSSLLSVELAQPLFDVTIRPAVTVAEARRDRQVSMNDQLRSMETQRIVEGFLRAVRLHALRRAADRVVRRLERELVSVSKSYEVNLVTINDVQTVKLSLAGMKRERNNYAKQLYHELAALGLSGEELASSWVQLAEGAELERQAPPEDVGGGLGPEERYLQAEVVELDQQARLSRRRSWPTVELYGRYELDSADGSVFGGARKVTGYAVGLAVRWDVFDRGIHRSEAREYAYRREAKTREIEAHKSQHMTVGRTLVALLEQAEESVRELEDLVAQHAVLEDSSARAYDAGKMSYLESITAYLAYESTVREWEGARHDRLGREVAHAAWVRGWNETLVQELDALFVLESAGTHGMSAPRGGRAQ